MGFGTRAGMTLALAAACTACNEDGATSRVQANPPPPVAPAPSKMHSLSVPDSPPAASQATPAGPATAASTGTGVVITQSSAPGNTQTLNINATGGTVTQRQGGSGNSQSMNIGTVDSQAGPTGTASRSP
jgi:hypothetical protein